MVHQAGFTDAAVSEDNHLSCASERVSSTVVWEEVVARSRKARPTFKRTFFRDAIAVADWNLGQFY